MRYLCGCKQKTTSKMTDKKAHQIIDISVDYDVIKLQLLYHNLYRQLKSARRKYKLSANELLVLNGIRLYTSLISFDFTESALIKFVGYYNQNRMTYYFKSLLSKNLIYIHRTAGVRVYYRLSMEAINIITDVFNAYDKRNRQFCEKFNISL